jgi:putative FmdB family regulatory protein
VPTYQYACTACGHQLEAVQSFADDPLTQCPECDGRLRKLFGSVGIVFKGPGFYRTDSRVASNGKRASSNGSGEKNSAGASTADKGSSNGSASASGSGTKDKAAAGTGSSSSSS